MTYKYVYSKPGSNHDEDEDEIEVKFPFADVGKKPFRVFEQTFTAQHVHFYLSKPVGEAEGYTDMIHRITLANPSDTIFIHLNIPGGQIDTGVQLINAMRNSQARIVTVLEATAYSLGTLIFLAGDEMVVNDNCMMMFHNFNGGLIGKGNELVSELEATVKWFQALAEDVYIPFLSREEFDRITRGEDMWMQTPEIRTRLECMVKVMKEKQEAEEKAEQEAEIEAVAALLAPAVEKKVKKSPPAKKTVPAKRTGPVKKTRAKRQPKTSSEE
jgi:ATP-dependent protease ClpP protease subunit